MEKIIIKGTSDIPEIQLDVELDRFLIAGMSMPEDVKEFYRPILEWLKNYIDNPKEKTFFDFKLIYFNTASSKLILEILYLLKRGIDAGHFIEVSWAYDEDDEEMLEAGEDYAEIVEMPIILNSVQQSDILKR